MRATQLTLVWLMLCLGAVLTPASESDAAGIGGEYLVGPGDVLGIAVFEVEELSKPLTVGPRGTIQAPLVGEVEVGGQTPQQIEQRLRQLYGRDLLRDPQISVRVEEFRSQPVSILGAVERPGVYQLRGRRRLVEVLAMAGGLAADVGERITIIRRRPSAGRDARALGAGGPERPGGAPGSEPPDAVEGGPGEVEIPVAVRDLLTMGAEQAGNPLIEAHDLIRVSHAGVIYVVGAVAKPGGYPIKDQQAMSVLRAVSLAQGLGRYSAPQKARVIRDLAGVKGEIAVPIRDILEGKAADFQLQDDDILFVPDSRAKSALGRGAEAAIQMATGIVIWGR